MELAFRPRVGATLGTAIVEIVRAAPAPFAAADHAIEVFAAAFLAANVLDRRTRNGRAVISPDIDEHDVVPRAGNLPVLAGDVEEKVCLAGCSGVRGRLPAG